jgi:hypothetical protein
MRRAPGRWTFRLVLLVALLAAGLLLPAGGALAQGGPQPLPADACNEGTETAHAAIPQEDNAAHDRVPHQHTFDAVTGCFHFNPTAEPPA